MKSREFVYFFKHKGINGIKIGKTSGSGVSERFKSFKTYSSTFLTIPDVIKQHNYLSVHHL